MSLLKKASKDNGENLLSWAKARMPILDKISQRFIEENPLKGIKIGVALHLEKKTGILLQTLHDGGAEISASSCNPLTTDNDVASALKDKMEIYGWAGQSDDEYYEALNSVMSSNPQVIIDDGCDLILLAHAKYSQNLGNILGACEETTTGIVRLEAMQSDGKLKFPVMAVNNAHSKYLFDNRYGTGQSVIEGIVSATNTLIAGKNIVIAGYGWCGKGLADRLKGLGAKVFVVETTTSFSSGPSGLHRALEALYDG
ncbi:MAG: adenosylhomocysteinase, partial [Candidatus Neomarinimicrobiota bacterium]|nr:adenosylhomocysteinase [Candidatus Neomarinimicrobiota bacterium]